jgi:predicted permease
VLSALTSLLLPLVLGVAGGRGGWLTARRDLTTESAIAVLNRFALLLAFPALVVASFLDPARGAAAIGWPLLVLASAPLLTGALVGAALGGRRIGRALLPSRGELTLVALFGNSAYLGLPLVAALVGPAAVPLGSVVVSMQVALTVTLGTAMLRADARTTPAGPRVCEVARTLLASPLAMSPLVGLALGAGLRALGLAAHPGTLALFHALDTLGKTASPLGLFVLGLFLGSRPPTLSGLAGQLTFALLRLVVVPGATLLLALVLSVAVRIPHDTLRTLVLLAAMPAAISTFAMAEDAGADREAVARAIVTTSVLSLGTLPAWLAIVERLGPR